jgi:hypothetical protein
VISRLPYFFNFRYQLLVEQLNTEFRIFGIERHIAGEYKQRRARRVGRSVAEIMVVKPGPSVLDEVAISPVMRMNASAAWHIEPSLRPE